MYVWCPGCRNGQSCQFALKDIGLYATFSLSHWFMGLYHVGRGKGERVGEWWAGLRGFEKAQQAKINPFSERKDYEI